MTNKAKQCADDVSLIETLKWNAIEQTQNEYHCRSTGRLFVAEPNQQCRCNILFCQFSHSLVLQYRILHQIDQMLKFSLYKFTYVYFSCNVCFLHYIIYTFTWTFTSIVFDGCSVEFRIPSHYVFFEFPYNMNKHDTQLN